MSTSHRHRIRIRNAALGIALLLIGVALPLTLTKGNQVVGGNALLVGLWSAAGACLLVWCLATEMVASRLPSVSFQRQGRNRTLVFSPPRKPLRGTRDLRRRAERLSRSILEFLAEWDRNDPFREHPAWGDHLSEEEKSRRWNESTNAGIKYFGEQMNRFSVDYSIEALALFDEFRANGLAKDEERHVFEYPTNTFGVREIAQKLGVWAKQL